MARKASVDPHRGMIERTPVPQDKAAELIRAQAPDVPDDQIAIAVATVEAMGRYFDEYDAQRVAAHLRNLRPGRDI
ncbi:hypothetical protein [Nonomuraea sp. NPDC050786]|uniref:hypothetical protein n=1 Tax=Nonomuraea sp. NPDC050786 TaxID=3154840 RepID=UPI0033C292F8